MWEQEKKEFVEEINRKIQKQTKMREEQEKEANEESKGRRNMWEQEKKE